MIMNQSETFCLKVSRLFLGIQGQTAVVWNFQTTLSPQTADEKITIPSYALTEKIHCIDNAGLQRKQVVSCLIVPSIQKYVCFGDLLLQVIIKTTCSLESSPKFQTWLVLDLLLLFWPQHSLASCQQPGLDQSNKLLPNLLGCYYCKF